MSTPFISAIVVAYQPRKYFWDAIESVLNQSLDESLYEIIIVTNFKIEMKNQRHRNVKYIVTDDSSIGYKLSLGVEIAKGEVIAFLEDDDIWEVNKLEILHKIFSNHPEIGFYHNNFSIIDDLGNEIDHQIHLIARRKLIKSESLLINAKTADHSEIRKMLNLAFDFNNSCISVRSKIINKHVDKLRTLVTGTDSFLFYSAFTSDLFLLGDSNLLTKYRVHDTNASKGGRVILDPNLTSWSITKEILKDANCNHKAMRSIDLAISADRLESFWRVGLIERKVMLRRLLQYMSYISKEDFTYNFLTVSFSCFYLLFPRLARRFQSKIYSEW